MQHLMTCLEEFSSQAIEYVSAERVKEVCWLAQIQKISSFILTQAKISAIVQHKEAGKFHPSILCSLVPHC